MSAFFRRTKHREELMVVFDDGQRVIVKNQEGNVMLDTSRFVFDETWKRGWFTDEPA